MQYCPDCGAPIQQQPASHCKTCHTELSQAANPDRARATMIERVPDEVLPERRQTMVEKVPDVLRDAVAAPGTKPSGTEPLQFRPLNRQPMAILVALDDGSSESGQIWRIRTSRHFIGRTSGQTVIPHDNDISVEHAEITCRWQEGSYRWSLTDLQSTNGTFLRVKKIVLRNQKELLLGGRRYQFRAPETIGPGVGRAAKRPKGDAKETSRFQNIPPEVMRDLIPRLVEVGSAGEGQEFPVPERKAWIGSDTSQCSILVDGDPFINPRHARIFLDERDRWSIEDAGSLNGVWIRVHRVPLESDMEFQIGEQRFLFKLL